MTFDGQNIWVANSQANNVSKINVTTNLVSGTVQVGREPTGLTFDGMHVWVANKSGAGAMNTVSRIHATSNVVTATLGVGKEPAGVAFDGTHIWVTNFGQNSVSKILGLPW
jgi:YVTN family beta-propeller protein